ncbi:MAG TPA: tRNA (adenosine(37)-N6)-threonylcarbamoyltransferase complex dimerization subunit type 1 TsaB [Candidatus Saccharimonas sp.]|nr:tRNA (adenosine(37)-N6)-threonylcarbamoyltransferase complex dimerization subunit type 1 TsaB [Candidatus Saccharimonas sp.]
MILTIKTDNPVAEVGLYTLEGNKILYHTWQADRQLAKDLLSEIHQQLAMQHADWPQITGLVVFKGPGSFTGLRIGLTVANALAYAQNIPIVAEEGDNWLQNGLARLKKDQNDKLALPHYGAEAHITLPKK